MSESAPEKAAYAKGYAAGQKRKRRDMSNEQRQAKRNAFWERAFLAALAECVSAQGWKVGEKPIVDIPMRTNLAKDFADEALKVAIKRHL